ncbi:hypothetical protein QVD17_00674 [Tagetes erecta]|uniref:Uncharacterized protein n=1 Tax=Tagetes erecta TaxID=13708 RepID=A0AAD8L678_TARER|nr:hypothetical protein QVD17_00674 [Tagetes erecta]
MNKKTKAITSPGRTDKLFPPPLMRFLKSNVGSKSRRSRSRASPMFLRKKNTITEATQDPSSPKVTCIGQVRVTCSKKNKKTTAASSHHRRHRHCHHNHLCRCLRKLKPTFCGTVWSKCVSFFRCCKNSDDPPVIKRTVTDSSILKLPYPSPNDISNHGEQEQEEEGDSINQGLISRSSSPSKNVFLLTRCRSAPYRSSSLASVFKESRGEDEVAEDLKVESEDGRCTESINGDEELKASPLILSRCKSEPARRWDQLIV